MSKIFFSYSHKDAAFVRKLVGHLSDLGFDILLDTKHLKGARPTQAEIHLKIQHSDYLIPVMTPDARRSEWVRPVEIAHALKLQREGGRIRILPVLRKQIRTPFDEISGLNYVDFRGDYSIALAKLIQALPNPEYDEISNLRKELGEEMLEDQSLLKILRKVAIRPGRRKTWSGLSAREFMVEVRRVVADEKLIDSTYWWLIVYGVLRFKDIDTWWIRKDRYQNSVKYAKVAPRGAELMDELSMEKSQIQNKDRFRRVSSGVGPKQ